LNFEFVSNFGFRYSNFSEQEFSFRHYYKKTHPQACNPLNKNIIDIP